MSNAFQKIIRKANKEIAVFSQVIVGITATLLLAANKNRIDAAILNVSNTKIYIGKSDVTPTNSIPILSETSISFDTYIGPLYGIVETGTATCGVVEL